MPQMSQILRERAIGMLTAGMSTRAVARELNVHFSTISRLQRRFREFGSTSNRPHNRRPRVTTPAQDLPHPASSPPRSSETSHPDSCCNNRFAYSSTCSSSSSGLDLTAVRRRNRLEWANAHIRWRLVLWRGALFTDESRFSLYRADGRQCVLHCVGERSADVHVVDQVAHGGGGVMVWAGICYGQRTQVHFIDGILNAQRYRDEILRPIVVPFIHDHHLMLQHDNAWPHVARICTQFLEAENIPVSCMASTLTRHVTHWACLGCSGSAYTTACSSSWQYPTTSHSHWRGVDQHSTGHNQQPDQLYAKEMANGGHTFCLHIKSLRSLSSAHEKWGQKQKCCVYIFVQCNCHTIRISY